MNGSRKALVIFVTVVVLLVVGLVAGDIFARMKAQTNAKEALQSVPGLTAENAEVKAKGEPFLTQAIAGKLKNVELKADALNFRVENADVQINQVDAKLQGLTVREPYVVDTFTGSAMVTTQSLQNLVNAKGLKMTVKSENGHLLLVTDIMRVPITVTLTATPQVVKSADLSRDVPGIEFKATDISLNIEKLTSGQAPAEKTQDKESADNKNNKDNKDKKDKDSKSSDKKKDTANKGVSLSDILQNFQAPTFVFPIEQAPSGLEITELKIENDGVHFSLAGSALNLSAISAPGTVIPTVPTAEPAPSDK